MAQETSIKEASVTTKLDALENIYGTELKEYEKAFTAKFKELHQTLKTASSKLEYFKWLDFDYLRKINQQSKELAASIKKQGMRNALVVGMGGSGIDSLVLANSLQDFSPNLEASFTGGYQSLRLLVQNNLDPSSLKSKLLKLDLAGELDKTVFIIISKSGSTDEVTRNTATIINYLTRSLGKAATKDPGLVLANLAKRMVIITEPAQEGKKNFLLELKAEIENKCLSASTTDSNSQAASKLQIPVLENHPWIGGRFSMFSPVGMLSAELMGLSSDELLKGAEECWQDFINATELNESTVARLALADIYLSRKQGFAYRYSMVYADALEALNKFRAQLKGESLNKTGIDSTVHIPGIGTVNHHSDLELLLKDNNKLVLEQIYFAKPSLDHINQPTGLEAFKNIEGESNHESLIRNHIKPLARYLTEKHCPVIETIISEQKEKPIAYYLMQDMLVTIVEAGLQDSLGAIEKLDLAIRQWEVEKYKKALRK